MIRAEIRNESLSAGAAELSSHGRHLSRMCEDLIGFSFLASARVMALVEFIVSARSRRDSPVARWLRTDFLLYAGLMLFFRTFRGPAREAHHMAGIVCPEPLDAESF